MRILNRCNLSIFSTIALLSSVSILHAEEIDPQSLLSMSLAELSDIEVTSVSKKAEKASEAAAAIYVLTNEDIKRSGATTIPDALRMVPGVNVAQSASHQWAVSARGFNGQFANKLLVLIDGRSIYTPIFSGVIWDVQDVMLEDIERIEVIRGPGATLWGANAVNGVINIITKSSKDTAGNYAKIGTGNYESGMFEGRHGGTFENGAYRVYAKHNIRDTLENANNSGNLADQWRKSQAGFRSDFSMNDGDSVTVQGDMYHLEEQFQFNLPTFLTASLTTPGFDHGTAQGMNMLGRWGHKINPASDITLQAYYDMTTRDVTYYNDSIHTIDLDMQHEYHGFDRNEIIWGLGYRYIYNDTTDTPYQVFRPADRGDQLISGFIQDEITLIPDQLSFTVGTKLEHNDYTNFEIQPSARFAWLPEENQTIWGAVSRAVRTPNRFVNDSTLKTAAHAGPPASGFVDSLGNSNLDSEELIAYELGYRVQPMDKLSLDIAAFYNDYDKLFRSNLDLSLAGLVSDPVFGTYLSLPLGVDNFNAAKSYGTEIAFNADLANNWQISGSYSYLNLKFDDLSSTGFSDVGRSPRHSFNLRSTYLFSHGVEMTNSLYYVDTLPSIAIKDYYRFDTRLSWEIQENVELNLIGQNLLSAQHEEFSGFLYQNQAEIGRTFYASAVFRF